MHKLAGLATCCTQHSLVKATLEGAKLKLARSVTPKQPLSLELVQKITDYYIENSSLAVVRFLFILLVGYAGFVRANELINLNVKDVAIANDHMSIYVCKRKNNQFRDGHMPFVNRSSKVTCPVAMTEKLLALLPGKAPDAPLIRRIIKTKHVEKFHESKGVSYSTIRDEFKKFLTPLVENINEFGLHSIKSGAASNPGCRSINAELLDKHAGWKCASPTQVSSHAGFFPGLHDTSLI
jgi:integrase